MPSTRLVPQEHRGRWVALIGLVTTSVAVAVIARGVDGRAVAEAFHAARDRPVPVAVAVAALASAFVVRAWAWRRVLPALSLGHSLAGIHLAYGANHVLPLRLGEPLRILSVVRRAGIGVGPATASTVTLRVADLVTPGQYIGEWLGEGTHYRMGLRGAAADNPDQRIAEDIKQFTDTT